MNIKSSSDDYPWWRRKRGHAYHLFFPPRINFHTFSYPLTFYIYWISHFFGLFVFCKAILIQNCDWNKYIVMTVICGFRAAYCQHFCLVQKADARLFFPYQDLINEAVLICLFQTFTSSTCFKTCCLRRLLCGPCPKTSKGYLTDSFCFPKIEFCGWEALERY